MYSRADVSAPLNSSPAVEDGRTPTLAALVRSPFWQSPFKSSWADTPSRLSTSGSTVASESDMRLPPPWSPDTTDRRLARVQEQRGWKYFFKHTLTVPLVFAVGLMLGAALSAWMLIGLGFGAAQASPDILPPAAESKAPYAAVLPPTMVPAAYMAAQPLNNSCLIKNLVIPDGPQTFDACGFVIKSTDEVWNLRGDVDAAIEKYFHEEYLDAGSWGRRIIGKKALRDAVLGEMRAFPDIKIHITDCVCKGNDNDGYKCAMPDVLTGTNLGPSSYGPPTGRFARWTGLVESLVKRNPATGQWQYYAEWGVHDEWSLIQQLGLDFSRVPRPPINDEPLHDCSPLLRFTPAPVVDKDDLRDQERHAAAKSVV